MSKKRTSDESNNDEQALFKNQDNAKRANADSNSDTALQDLPMELLECILVKVVATEVIGLKLVKSVWKEKADLEISRLSTVCSQWTSILSTNSFRVKLHRILDDTAEKSIRLEVLHEHLTLYTEIFAVTSMNDEIFMMHKKHDQNGTIDVYDRNNMAVVKDIIPLPGEDPVCMEACNVSNCVYVGLQKKIAHCLSVIRISKDAEHQFSILSWVDDHRMAILVMSVTANGSLIMISEKHQWERQVVSVYDAIGVLQQEIQIPHVSDTLRYKSVLQRSNGNFILAYVARGNNLMMLSEVDASGSIVRQYQSSHFGETFVSFADIYGRIVMGEPFGGIELLDSEFNLQGTYALQQDQGKTLRLHDLHFDSESNEILRIHYDCSNWDTDLTIFRFIEE